MDLKKQIEELELIMDNSKNISYLMDWNSTDWKEKLVKQFKLNFKLNGFEEIK